MPFEAAGGMMVAAPSEFTCATNNQDDENVKTTSAKTMGATLRAENCER